MFFVENTFIYLGEVTKLNANGHIRDSKDPEVNGSYKFDQSEDQRTDPSLQDDRVSEVRVIIPGGLILRRICIIMLSRECRISLVEVYVVAVTLYKEC